ncbi:hypothetical protein J6590_011488 [Homalodisca vitripennis]|nr:hypothetical protein J6590_011488 [Homalodisca vitripennis]
MVGSVTGRWAARWHAMRSFSYHYYQLISIPQLSPIVPVTRERDNRSPSRISCLSHRHLAIHSRANGHLVWNSSMSESDFRTTATKAGQTKNRIAQRSPSKQQPARCCLIRLSCDNCFNRYTVPLAPTKASKDQYVHRKQHDATT